MSSASVQWVFFRSSYTCRCISNISVGRKVISASYSSAILKLLPWGELFNGFDSQVSHSVSEDPG